jgi:hypothetical protein
LNSGESEVSATTRAHNVNNFIFICESIHIFHVKERSTTEKLTDSSIISQ